MIHQPPVNPSVLAKSGGPTFAVREPQPEAEMAKYDGGKHRNHYRALEKKSDANRLTLSVVAGKGGIDMILPRTINRSEAAQLQRAVDEITFRCTPHRADTLSETERRWMLLDAFIHAVESTEVKYRNHPWRLSYVIDRLLGYSTILALRETREGLTAKISNAANAALEFDPAEINRLRELKESASAKAAAHAVKKLLGE